MLFTKKNYVGVFFCAMLVCAAVLTGCNETAVLSSPEEALTPPGGALELSDYSSIQNPDNPCNDFGILHNAGLDYILTSTGAQTFEELDYAQIKTAAAGYVISIAELLESSDQAEVEAMLDNVVVNLSVEDAYSDLPISEEQIQFCRDVHAAAVDEEIATLQEMLDALNAVETEIIDSAIPEHQKELPLVVVAVAKHSAAYHADYLDLPTAAIKHPSGTILADDPDKKKKRFRQVVEADLVGAITGALGGFVSGLVGGAIGGSILGGPVGGIPGAAAGAMTASAVGAVGGAVVNSANAIIKPS